MTIIIFQITVQQLEAVGFLDLSKSHITIIDDPKTIVTVIQRPSESTCTQIAAGPYGHQFGFEFYHQVSTTEGSSGSPVILLEEDKAHVIGIHKASLEINYNLAVSMQTVLNALDCCIDLYYFSEQLIVLYNPTFEDCQKELDISGNKLSLIPKANRSNWPIYYYDSVVSFSGNNSSKQTHVWFIPTVHRWYWTPGDDFHPADHSINWMTFSQTIIVGGDFNEYELVDRNALSIIDFLPTIEYHT